MKRNQNSLLRNGKGGTTKIKPKRSAGARILEHWDLGRNVVSPTHLQLDAADVQSVTLPKSVSIVMAVKKQWCGPSSC